MISSILICFVMSFGSPDSRKLQPNLGVSEFIKKGLNPWKELNLSGFIGAMT